MLYIKNMNTVTKMNLEKKEVFSISLEDLFAMVCNYFRVNVVSASQPSRKKELKHVRQVAHYLAVCHTDYSLSSIGMAIGFKDHATVLNSKRVILNEITPLQNGFILNRKLAKDIAILRIKLRQKEMNIDFDYYNTIGTLVSYLNYSEQ